MKSMTLLCILTVVGISLTATPVQAKKPAAEVQQATKHQQQPPLLMDRAQIHALNTAISQKMGGPITDETAPMTAEKLKSELSRYQMKRALYHDGRLMTEKEKKELISCAYGRIPSVIPLRYGVTVKRTDLKSFPTGMRAYSAPTDRDFDVFQETTVDPAVPVLIYHEDATGRFLFVRAYFYRGWVPKESVAETDRATWLTYAAPKEKAVVTNRVLTLGKGKDTALYQMGSSLPLEKGHLLLPMRDQAGRLVIQKEKARFDDSLHKGPLPYTEENLLILARRHLGAPYGWGGRKESVDCSALTQDVYRSMGIELPRNSGEQARTTPGVSFQGLSRKALIAVKDIACWKSPLYARTYHDLQRRKKRNPHGDPCLRIQGCQGKGRRSESTCHESRRNTGGNPGKQRRDAAHEGYEGDSDKVEGCQAVTSLRLSPSCGQGRGCQAKAGKDALMLKDRRGKDLTAAPNRVLHLTAETSSQRGLAARTVFCL